MTSAAGARGCLVGAFAGRWPSQADPGMVIKRKFGSGVALIHGGALWWTPAPVLGGFEAWPGAMAPLGASGSIGR